MSIVIPYIVKFTDETGTSSYVFKKYMRANAINQKNSDIIVQRNFIITPKILYIQDNIREKIMRLNDANCKVNIYH